MDKKLDFLELLILNNPEQIHEFLISNGKKPKAVSPIIFLEKEEVNQNGTD